MKIKIIGYTLYILGGVLIVTSSILFMKGIDYISCELSIQCSEEYRTYKKEFNDYVYKKWR